MFFWELFSGMLTVTMGLRFIFWSIWIPQTHLHGI
jgi:hypothetical protein